MAGTSTPYECGWRGDLNAGGEVTGRRLLAGAGIQVARPLDDLADVVLVEPKDDFVHNVAALRALVDPSWLERIYLPYTGLLGRSRVIRDRAVKADADRVVLASGAELSPDYLVLATGSGYPFPAKSDLPVTEAAHGKVRSAHAAPHCCCSPALLPLRPSGRASR